MDLDEEKFGTYNLERSRASAPTFGTSTSPFDEVKAFYNYWELFSSKMTFAWVDDYDPAEVWCGDVVLGYWRVLHLVTGCRGP